jgi:hypothetical protein
MSYDSPPLNLSGHQSNTNLLPGFERLECLWRSVECIKALLDAFYMIPPSELVGLPFHFWSQMILFVTVLKYLSTLGDPAWDCRAVRNTVDLISTMDRLVEKLDLASKEPSLQCEDNNNLFMLLSRLFSKCRVWAEAWWNVPPPIPDAGLSGSWQSDVTGATWQIPDLDQMVWLQSMDLESDSWLDSILGGHTAFS